MKFLKNVVISFICFNFVIIGSLSAQETLKVSAVALEQKIQELNTKISPHDQLREKLIANLDKKSGQKILSAYGVDKEEFKMRLMAMSERDLREMLESEKQVGGDVVVISLSTLLIIIILLLLID